MELAEHATKVMSNFDEVINSLDDMDYFFRHLHNVGKLHRKLPGFKKEYFFVSNTVACIGHLVIQVVFVIVCGNVCIAGTLHSCHL